jgi:hypothetical protein
VGSEQKVVTNQDPWDILPVFSMVGSSRDSPLLEQCLHPVFDEVAVHAQQVPTHLT